MSKKLEKKIPFFLALFYVVLSAAILWAAIFLSLWYKDYTLEKKKQDSRYTIVGILAHCEGENSLSNSLLTALAGLSKHEPMNLYEFDPHMVKQRLETLACMHKASACRIRPNAVYMSYELKKPSVSLADFENAALDEDGFAFFLSPVYAPQKLPEMYLGVQTLVWHEPLASVEYVYACGVFKMLQKYLPAHIQIMRIDTHNVQAKSQGEKEIVVVVADDHATYYVRLGVCEYEKKLRQVVRLLTQLQKTKHFIQKEHIIDYRFDGFLLIK